MKRNSEYVLRSTLNLCQMFSILTCWQKIQLVHEALAHYGPILAVWMVYFQLQKQAALQRGIWIVREARLAKMGHH